jgi:hypothetical protein
MSKQTKGSGHLVGVRVQPDLLGKVDAWRQQQTVVPSRSSSLRALAEIGLETLQAEQEAA